MYQFRRVTFNLLSNREFTMNKPIISRIYSEFTIFFSNSLISRIHKKITCCLANSLSNRELTLNTLWIHYRFRELTMNSLTISSMNSLTIFLSHYELTIFFANSFWIHFFFQIHYLFGKLSITQIHYELTINIANFVRIFVVFRGFTINSLCVSQIHYRIANSQ